MTMALVVNCFQNCTFTYDSQHPQILIWWTNVVNCFQNCTFTYDSQQICSWIISIKVVNCFQNCTFTYDSQHHFVITPSVHVVNCFQNCTFTYDSQHEKTTYFMVIRCELLSKLYFYLWFPTLNMFAFYINVLWIAFKIVLLLMIPNSPK